MSTRPPVWWSLCCGLDAVASWAMAKRRPPVSRMGGKGAYRHDVARILGEHPRTWHMVDADPAIVLWWSAVFGGWLDQVAERIRAYDLDGEELWRSIVYANGKNGKDGPALVPVDPVERLAAWLIAQKGNFSAKPLGWNPLAFAGERGWEGVSGFNYPGESAIAAGFPASKVNRDPIADKVAAWQGVAGYGHVSEAGLAKGFQDRVNREAVAVQATPRIAGAATLADLNTWAPDFRPGDLATIDPPYSGTTGYGEVLPRDRVVELALQAEDAGARVLVHEAEALWLPPGSRDGWRSLDLRKGERMNQDTFRRRGRNGAREVVTINFEPADRLGEQVDLFS